MDGGISISKKKKMIDELQPDPRHISSIDESTDSSGDEDDSFDCCNYVPNYL
jgi:hypothetical protein